MSESQGRPKFTQRKIIANRNDSWVDGGWVVERADTPVACCVNQTVADLLRDALDEDADRRDREARAAALLPRVDALIGERSVELGVDPAELEDSVAEALDDLVHEGKGDEAASINNGGLEDQVAYLLAGGLTEDDFLAEVRDLAAKLQDKDASREIHHNDESASG